MRLVSKASVSNLASMAREGSLQLWNFSSTQAASPAGESVRPTASVCGLVAYGVTA
jgi:hypothetical protein